MCPPTSQGPLPASHFINLHLMRTGSDLEKLPSGAVPGALPGGSVSAWDEMSGGGQLPLSWTWMHSVHTLGRRGRGAAHEAALLSGQYVMQEKNQLLAAHVGPRCLNLWSQTWNGCLWISFHC